LIRAPVDVTGTEIVSSAISTTLIGSGWLRWIQPHISSITASFENASGTSIEAERQLAAQSPQAMQRVESTLAKVRVCPAIWRSSSEIAS
jgi:hypothetical protein